MGKNRGVAHPIFWAFTSVTAVSAVAVMFFMAASQPVYFPQSGSAFHGQSEVSGQSDTPPAHDPGEIRTPESCLPGTQDSLKLSDILLQVNGVQTKEIPFIRTGSDLPQWEGAASDPTRSTIVDGVRYHLIGVDDAGTGLANLQALASLASPASSAEGLLASDGFQPFGDVTFLDKQLPGQFQAAAIAGDIHAGRAVWLEQLVGTQAPNAHEYAWRVMTAKAQAGSPVVEVISSYSLSGKETLPAPTPWRSPVTTGDIVAVEYRNSEGEQGKESSRIALVNSDKPGVVSTEIQGRLPISVGQNLAWVEDTTSHGVDAENDIFTIRWMDEAFPAIVLETSSFAKVQWLEGNDRFLVVVLQDTCTAMSWIGRYDRELGVFTAWVSTEQDRVAASLKGNVLVWGNGSGNRGEQMYRWDLETDAVQSLGELAGYSIPFVGGTRGVAVPRFTTDGGAPLVAWEWFSAE